MGGGGPKSSHPTGIKVYHSTSRRGRCLSDDTTVADPMTPQDCISVVLKVFTFVAVFITVCGGTLPRRTWLAAFAFSFAFAFAFAF
jgi:hypothetical protein